MAYSKTKTFTIKLTASEADKMLRSSDGEGDAKARASWSETKGEVTVQVEVISLPSEDSVGEHDHGGQQGAQHRPSRRTHRPTHLPILP